MDKVAELLVWMGDGQMTVSQKDDRERYIEIYREELEAENPDIDDIRTEEWSALALLLYPAQVTDVVKAYDGEIPGPSPRYPDLELQLLKEVRLRLPVEPRKENVCTCHERDSTYTCPKCHSEGTYGHGEEPTDTHYECEELFCTTPEPNGGTMKVSVEMEKTDWMAILSHTEADRQEALARGETEAAERMEKFKSAIHKGLFKSATGERT